MKAIKREGMPSRKLQPSDADEAQRRASAFGAWMMSNVRREIAAGRVRRTITDDGEAATIH